MAKAKAVKGEVVQGNKHILQAVSYGEQDGFGEYSVTELERQDRENEKALSALDRRYAGNKEYDGTNFDKLRKEAIEEQKDPKERFAFYPNKTKLTKKGKILTGRGEKSFWLRMDGEKKPFLCVGGEDIITIGVDLPKAMPCPSGVELTLLKWKNIGSIIIKGQSKTLEVSFLCAKTSQVWFGYSTTEKLPDTPDMVSFG